MNYETRLCILQIAEFNASAHDTSKLYRNNKSKISCIFAKHAGKRWTKPWKRSSLFTTELQRMVMSKRLQQEFQKKMRNARIFILIKIQNINHRASEKQYISVTTYWQSAQSPSEWQRYWIQTNILQQGAFKAWERETHRIWESYPRPWYQTRWI